MARARFKTEYNIVDAIDDPIRVTLFKPWAQIPVRFKSIKFKFPNTFIVTLRYMHEMSDEEVRNG